MNEMPDEFEVPSLDTEVEIAAGVFKRLGDCTRDDLHSAASVAEQRANLWARKRTLLHRLVALSATQGRDLVPVPPSVAEDFESARRGEPLPEYDVTTLRQHTHELEAVIAMLTPPKGEG